MAPKANLLSLQKDLQGLPTNAHDFPQYIWNAALAINVASHITVPGNYSNWLARIIGNVDAASWFISVNHVASAPAGATFAKSTSDMFNAYFYYEVKVKAGDTISVLFTNSTFTTLDCSIALFPVLNGAY